MGLRDAFFTGPQIKRRSGPGRIFTGSPAVLCLYGEVRNQPECRNAGAGSESGRICRLRK